MCFWRPVGVRAGERKVSTSSWALREHRRHTIGFAAGVFCVSGEVPRLDGARL